MSETDAVTMESIVAVDQDLEPYVLQWPEADEEDGYMELFAVVVMKRAEGLLLAVPVGVLPETEVIAGNLDGASCLGVSTVVEVPSVIMDGGQISPTGSSLCALLVDVDSSIVIHRLRLPEPFEEIVYGFDLDSPFALPSPQDILKVAREWIEEGPQGVLAFYSAEEGQGIERKDPSSSILTSPAKAPPQKKPQATKGQMPQLPGVQEVPGEKQKPKRPTTASLAAGLDQLMTTIPALSTQVRDLAMRTKSIEEHVSGPSSVSYPALRQPLSRSVVAPTSAPSALTLGLPSPPRTKHAPSPGLLRSPAFHQPPEVEALEQEKFESSNRPSDDHLARAVLAQSQALTNLVNQIALTTSDPLADLSGTSASGTRGSLGRAKLQQELASQRGTFFASVMAAMSRRMNPTLPPAASYQLMMLQGVCGTKYLERFGGYSRHRDLGQLMFQVMQVMDCVQTENWPAARDHLALLCVTIEQAAMDNGRFELASVLCLMDDLPSGIFQNRQAGVLSRSQSFSPLADQRWITIALAYLKEMDTIIQKRSEIAGNVPPKNPGPSNPSLAGAAQTKSKAAAKRKGKGKGQQNAPASSSTNHDEGEEA